MLRFVFLLGFLITPLAVLAESGGANIVHAEYGPDVDIYPHRIMGDVYEKQELIVFDENGRTWSLFLTTNVFEDISPRVADMDNDGRNDVVVIETNPDLGASLTIYSLDKNGLFKLAATPHIGRSFRWLAPAGIADFNRDGQDDVAYVETPHLGKVLRFWTIRDGALEEIAAVRGLTNHQIGDEFISGGVRTCDGSPEVVTANSNWSRVFATRLVDGASVFSDIGPYEGLQSFEKALACR